MASLYNVVELKSYTKNETGEYEEMAVLSAKLIDKETSFVTDVHLVGEKSTNDYKKIFDFFQEFCDL